MIGIKEGVSDNGPGQIPSQVFFIDHGHANSIHAHRANNSEVVQVEDSLNAVASTDYLQKDPLLKLRLLPRRLDHKLC